MWPWSRIAEMKRALSEALDESDKWESIAGQRLAMMARHIAEVERLSKALSEATKNDARDPRTGRFTKAT
jgi:hypothetical protein